MYKECTGNLCFINTYSKMIVVNGKLFWICFHEQIMDDEELFVEMNVWGGGVSSVKENKMLHTLLA